MKSIIFLLVAFVVLNTNVHSQPQIGLDAQTHNGAGCSTGTLSVVALVVGSGTCGPIIGRTNPLTLTPGTGSTIYDYNAIATGVGWDIDPNPFSPTNQWGFVAAYVYNCEVASYSSGPTGTNGTCGNGNEDWVLVGDLSCFTTDSDCMTYSTSNCGCSSGEEADILFSPGGLGLSLLSVTSN